MKIINFCIFHSHGQKKLVSKKCNQKWVISKTMLSIKNMWLVKNEFVQRCKIHLYSIYSWNGVEKRKKRKRNISWNVTKLANMIHISNFRFNC